MKRKCRAIFAISDSREQQIYSACDMCDIDDEDITVAHTGNGNLIIFVTCNQRQWKLLKHELNITKYWV